VLLYSSKHYSAREKKRKEKEKGKDITKAVEYIELNSMED
jgi:hypothetical protein